MAAIPSQVYGALPYIVTIVILAGVVGRSDRPGGGRQTVREGGADLRWATRSSTSTRSGCGVRQFHIGVAPGEVSTIALLPGDPFRVPLIAEHLTDVREVAHKREHRTMVGTYGGREITATSTGMGCPSTAIAVEELARVGVTSFIRVGSTGGAPARHAARAT